MEFLDPISALLGITTTQLLIVSGTIILLVIGWYALKMAIKVATKVFTIGCFTIIVIGVALYLFFAFFV
jgi:hypothetical protein